MLSRRRVLLIAMSLGFLHLAQPLEADPPVLPPDTGIIYIGAGSTITVSSATGFGIPANQSSVRVQNAGTRCDLIVSPSSEYRYLPQGRPLVVTGAKSKPQGLDFYVDSLMFGNDGTVKEMDCTRGFVGHVRISDLSTALSGQFELVAAGAVAS